VQIVVFTDGGELIFTYQKHVFVPVYFSLASS